MIRKAGDLGCALLVIAASAASGELEIFPPPGSHFPQNLSPLPSPSGDCGRLAFQHAGQVYAYDLVGGRDVLVSVAAGGGSGAGDSGWPRISEDGSIVVFGSYASNLVREPKRVRYELFVRDLDALRTIRVDGANGFAQVSGNGRVVIYGDYGSPQGRVPEGSVHDLYAYDLLRESRVPLSIGPDNALGDGDSRLAAVNRAGTVVLFTSDAANLVPGDDNGVVDVFLHDRRTGSVHRVSQTQGPGSANGHSDLADLDSAGRTVAFASDAANLVSGDTNEARDIFVWERESGRVERVSRAANGGESDGSSDYPAISGDGRLIAFMSRASNLVPGDQNGYADVFVHDRNTGRTWRVSESAERGEGNEESGVTGLALSADGSCLLFESWASNLVEGDANRAPDVFIWRRPADVP